MKDKLITIIGSGNLASNLAYGFWKAGLKVHVNARNQESLRFIADRSPIPVSSGFEDLPDDSDLFIICITDEAIQEITNIPTLKEKINKRFVVHTSGSVTSEVLANLSINYGVLYPLQTFTREIPADFKHIPICIEANNGFNQDLLIKYALQLSDDVRRISSEQRQYIHLAAVFANNFSNRMMAIAEEILNTQHIDFNILLPLIEESARKIKLNSPGKIQTGPASRKDMKTIEHHLNLLTGKDDLKLIYKTITDNIIKNNTL